MRNYPVFIPYGKDRLAAVLTVPDGEPRGLVLLLTGGSAARSHRFKVWTRTAEQLASEHDLASVRMDYRGTGDSTGALRQWKMSEMPVDQALEVLRFAQVAAGVRRVAVVGNCMGARLALEVALRVPECVGTLCIRTPILGPGAAGKLLEKVKRGPLAISVRRDGFLRQVVARRLLKRKKRSSAWVRRPVARTLEQGHLLFLYSEQDFTFNEQVRRELDEMASRLRPKQRARYELRVLSGGWLKGFESLDIQTRVIDAVVDWMGDRFPASEARSESARATAEVRDLR
jgi:pimeloyl-ACP methyl ester carboxylesterase